MRAVLPVPESSSRSRSAGGEPPRPAVGDVPDPSPEPDEVLVAVKAAGLNHADLLQMRGQYPPPRGESEVPGLELAGVVEEVGARVDGFEPGQRVMALVAGGAHATRAAVPAGQLMRLSGRLSFVEGAAIPEGGLTAWTNLVAEGGLRAGETVLVTGASGGMGRSFVQLAHELGARVIAAGRDLSRLEPLRDLGADALVELGDDFPERVREASDGRGADLAIDLVGGQHLARCLEALAHRGRCVLVGLLAGRRAEIPLDRVLRHRLRLVGSVLRARSRSEKAKLVADFADFALPRIEDGRLLPQVDRTFPLERAAEAYAALREGGVEGKVILEMAD